MAGSYFLGVACLRVHLHIPRVYSLALRHTDIHKSNNENLKALLNYGSDCEVCTALLHEPYMTDV
jgi:hypothetical protein